MMHCLLLQVGHAPILALPAPSPDQGMEQQVANIQGFQETILILNFYFALARDNLKMDRTRFGTALTCREHVISSGCAL